jgi:GAF domain-containing protein
MSAESVDERTDRTVRAALCDPARLRALAESGLASAADADMDGIAERVRRRLGVPIALVSLVHPHQQVFPGMAGLPEPWAAERAMPLSHSFCRHVIVSATPLVVADAREHPLVRENAAVEDIGVVAYAGMPLLDGAGHVLGTLCAIDSRPRRWSATELETLEDLAHACGSELRLRLAHHDARRERTRRDELDQALARSYDRSQTLLKASQAFTGSTTLAQVHGRLHGVLAPALTPSYVGIALLGEDGRLHRLPDPTVPVADGEVAGWLDCDLGTVVPVATAVRESRAVHYPDRAGFDEDHPLRSRELLRVLDLHAVIAVPVPGDRRPRGAVVLGWDRSRALAGKDVEVIITIAGYAANAVARTELQQHRIDVAHQLQKAMLTDLPAVPGLRMAAHYRPADSRDQVGGDWYDASALADPADPGRPLLVVTVGDIIGHATDAAAIMGQARSMIRQARWDHPGAAPTQTLAAFESANGGLRVGAAGTLVLAELQAPVTDPGPWTVTWTNAGHPPPVVVHPDGMTDTLDAHDAMFGFAALRDAPRHDHCTVLEPGSTLFLYTDGLIEHRGHDLDAGLDNLRSLLGDHRTLSPQRLVETAVSALAPDAPDDVVAFAITVPT